VKSTTSHRDWLEVIKRTGALLDDLYKEGSLVVSRPPKFVARLDGKMESTNSLNNLGVKPRATCLAHL
jgi:hypothetical protein